MASNPKMFYTVVCSWVVQGSIVVEANSLEEAKEGVYDMPLPPKQKWEYVDDTFEVDNDATETGHPQR